MAAEVLVPGGVSGRCNRGPQRPRRKNRLHRAQAGILVITVTVPLSRMFGYSTALRSAPRGAEPLDALCALPPAIKNGFIRSRFFIFCLRLPTGGYPSQGFFSAFISSATALAALSALPFRVVAVPQRLLELGGGRLGSRPLQVVDPR